MIAPSNDSLLQSSLGCLIMRPSSFVFLSFNITNIALLLPVCIFILYLGLGRCSSHSAATISHADIFTFNVVAMELMGVFGSALCCCGLYNDSFSMVGFGYLFLIFTWYGEGYFHCLTCAERYLAAVHPTTYLSLRSERGVRIRNVTIGCVWLICSTGTCLTIIDQVFFILCTTIFHFIVISFCSLFLLRVLIRPGPGEKGGDRERVDRSKRRAFYTIIVIWALLVLRLSWNVTWSVLQLRHSQDCVSLTCESWFNLPSSLVLPLMFLLRSRKRVCCQNNIK